MEIPERLAAIVGFITIHRVMGELSLTRAIGDPEFKGALKNDFFNKEFKGDLILAEPEITEQELNPVEDEFLILVSQRGL
jgi:serine/threonine protein phosphatase PrpC